MTTAEFRSKWSQRLAEWRRFGASVNGVAVAEEVLADVDQLEHESQLGSVTLKEAHRIGGYSIDHLQRILASGQIENVGRKHRPRIRRRDVPVKPGHQLPNPGDGVQLSERRRIAASFVTGDDPT